MQDLKQVEIQNYLNTVIKDRMTMLRKKEKRSDKWNVETTQSFFEQAAKVPDIFFLPTLHGVDSFAHLVLGIKPNDFKKEFKKLIGMGSVMVETVKQNKIQGDIISKHPNARVSPNLIRFWRLVGDGKDGKRYDNICKNYYTSILYFYMFVKKYKSLLLNAVNADAELLGDFLRLDIDLHFNCFMFEKTGSTVLFEEETETETQIQTDRETFLSFFRSHSV